MLLSYAKTKGVTTFVLVGVNMDNKNELRMRTEKEISAEISRCFADLIAAKERTDALGKLSRNAYRNRIRALNWVLTGGDFFKELVVNEPIE